MNELLICSASTRASVVERDNHHSVIWHPHAEVWFGDGDNTTAWDEVGDTTVGLLAGVGTRKSY
jgi:hypothetical protein